MNNFLFFLFSFLLITGCSEINLQEHELPSEVKASFVNEANFVEVTDVIFERDLKIRSSFGDYVLIDRPICEIVSNIGSGVLGLATSCEASGITSFIVPFDVTEQQLYRYYITFLRSQNLQVVNDDGIIIVKGSSKEEGAIALPSAGSEEPRYIGLDTGLLSDFSVTEQVRVKLLRDVDVESMRQNFPSVQFITYAQGVVALGSYNDISLLESVSSVLELTSGSTVVYGLNADLVSQMSGKEGWFLVLDESSSTLSYSVPTVDFEDFKVMMASYIEPRKNFAVQIVFFETEERSERNFGTFLEHAGFSIGTSGGVPFTSGGWSTFVDVGSSVDGTSLMQQTTARFLSGTTASVVIGDRVPIVTSVVQDGATQQVVEYVQTGYEIELSGKYSDGGLADIEYVLTVSNVISDNDLPRFSERTFEGKFAVGVGSVIHLGSVKNEQTKAGNSLLSISRSSENRTVDVFARIEIY